MATKNGMLRTAGIALGGAVVGSFSMMLFASTHFSGVAGPNNTPPAVSAAPIYGGSDQDRITSAVKRVLPSVVALYVTVNGQQVVPSDPFAQFFGRSAPQQLRKYQAQASGSGFVYAKSGLIVTNAHVVVPPSSMGTVSKIEVVFANGDRVAGHVFSANLGADLALVKIDPYGKLPPPIEIGDSSRLQQGQWAIAIGEPFELKQTVTVGVVSGFNRNETIGAESGGSQQFKGLLQTSAPINPGNSGGPLIDVEGRLIGVNQSTANPQAGAQGIGFAIPSNEVKTQIALLEKAPGTHQGTNTGFIGASLAAVTPNLRVQLNYKGDGVAVASVIGGGAADLSGLQPGDVITRVNAKPATRVEDVIDVIKATKPGGSVNLEVWSAGVKKLVVVKVQERPANIGAFAPQGGAPQPFGP